jgi:TnpA family transposase
LYSINKESLPKELENIITEKINTKIIEKYYDDVMRLAHSISEGKSSAALIVSKLGSY